MNVTTRARYALRAVIDIADNAGGGSVRAADVARRQRISARYLERLLAALAESGVVESRKGPGGGYRLARPAADISVRDVILASGEMVALPPCMDVGSESCELAAGCPAHAVWDGLRRVADDYLAGCRISDLVGTGSRAVNTRKNGLRLLRPSAGPR